jgi:hypothetical protein
MKPTSILLAFAALLSADLAVAQTNEPADDWKPAPSNQQGK